MLESGATRIVNSDIADNIYDGIFIGILDGIEQFKLAMLLTVSCHGGTKSNATVFTRASNGRNGAFCGERFDLDASG